MWITRAMILEFLLRHPEPVSYHTIAGFCDVGPRTVVRAISALQQEGVIARQRPHKRAPYHYRVIHCKAQELYGID
jgi:DNA-binding IclR family transcriptional regulator